MMVAWQRLKEPLKRLRSPTENKSEFQATIIIYITDAFLFFFSAEAPAQKKKK